MDHEHPTPTWHAEQTAPRPGIRRRVWQLVASRLAAWFVRLRAILATWARHSRRAWQGLRPVLQQEGHALGNDLRAAFGHLQPRRLGLILAGLVVITYLLSGLYTVQPGEVAVIQRFGSVLARPLSEGLQYRLPWPFEKQTIVHAAAVRRESVGLGQPEADHPLHLQDPTTLQVLTGDVNFVDYEIIAQYQVREPAAYLFNLNYVPYQLVRDAVQAAVMQLSSTAGVDAILTTDRQAMQQAVRREVQALLDTYESGLEVLSINLQKAYPPDEVASAFRDVSSAREDKDRAINEAEAYRNHVIPEARGEASRLLAEATSQATVDINQASGAAEAFKAILAQYHADRQRYGAEVTRYRLYLEQMEQILPRVKMFVVHRGEQVNLRLLNGTGTITLPPMSAGP